MSLLWLVIGLFIGWNFPQPQFAKDMQEKIKGMFK